MRDHAERMKAVDGLNQGIHEEIKRLQHLIEVELKDVCGEYKDEISLLN